MTEEGYTKAGKLSFSVLRETLVSKENYHLFIYQFWNRILRITGLRAWCHWKIPNLYPLEMSNLSLSRSLKFRLRKNHFSEVIWKQIIVFFQDNFKVNFNPALFAWRRVCWTIIIVSPNVHVWFQLLSTTGKKLKFFFFVFIFFV